MSFALSDDIEAKWWEHYQLNFWLWACLRNGSAYLEAHRKFIDATATQARFNRLLHYEQSLASYHFVLSVGRVVRALKRAQRTFPQIQRPFSRAHHLLTEGALLRGMIEHSEYLLDGNGRYPDRFVRSTADMTSDATGTFVDQTGHWLGGRLCVEIVLEEVEAIYKIAKTIPQPT